MKRSTAKPYILIYTDDPMCSIACADATMDVLNQSKLYNVRMIGPSAYPKLTFNAVNLKKADCIIFPGGDGDADQFDISLTNYKQIVKRYVARGGRYLGICQGSYFAGKYYFNLLTGMDAVQYIKRTDTSVTRSGPAVADILWEEEEASSIYFHDGAAFVPTQDEYEANILAHYPNGDAAALIQEYKKGKVAVFGPHPEAQKWWFYSQKYIHDKWKDSIQHQMLLDIVKGLLE